MLESLVVGGSFVNATNAISLPAARGFRFLLFFSLTRWFFFFEYSPPRCQAFLLFALNCIVETYVTGLPKTSLNFFPPA